MRCSSLAFSIILSKFFVPRDVVKEQIFFTVIVHLATVMLQSVRHDEIVGMEQKIIRGDLVEHFLGECDGGCLVLDDHPGVESLVVEHAVGTQLLLPHLQLDLIGQQRGGITEVPDEVMNEILANPFLGGERHIATPKDVENARVLSRAL